MVEEIKSGIKRKIRSEETGQISDKTKLSYLNEGKKKIVLYMPVCLISYLPFYQCSLQRILGMSLS